MHLGAFCAANAPDRESERRHAWSTASGERETYRPGPDSTRTAHQLVLALTNSTLVHAKNRWRQPTM